ncbi:hypothetical protein OBA41_02365 [Pelagibacteraceae bacterium]|nr:hypothetical protein [Pelagibacteraceae bacterium]
MLNLLLGPIVDIVGTSVKGFVDTKKAKAEQKVTEIKAKTSLMEKQIKGEVDWDIEAIKNTKGSWKDEYLTILFSIPLLLCFLPWTVGYVEDGFAALSKTPDWYKYTLGVIVSASFGIKGASRFFGKK